jgi:translation initiation factor 4B
MLRRRDLIYNAASDSRPGYGSDRRGFSSAGPGAGMGSAFGGPGGGSSSYAGRFSSPSSYPMHTHTILDRGYSMREQLPLPSEPPYTAHLANLSFDAGDDDVNDFFRDCEVKEVRIVKDRMDDKPKGFGYVTFESLEGLKTALSLSGGSLAGRQVRVSVAEPRKYHQTWQNTAY